MRAPVYHPPMSIPSPHVSLKTSSVQKLNHINSVRNIRFPNLSNCGDFLWSMRAIAMSINSNNSLYIDMGIPLGNNWSFPKN